MREQNMPAYGIMFHHFCNNVHPRGQGAVSEQELVDILKHVGLKNILPADEWMHRALKDGLQANDVCLTFDDALQSQIDVALPVLEDLGLTAFWFVYSSVFEGRRVPLEIYRYFRTVSFSTVEDFYGDFMRLFPTIFPGELGEALQRFDAEKYLAEFPFYTRGDRLFRYLRDEILSVSRYNCIMEEMMAQKSFDVSQAAQFLWMNNEHLARLQSTGHMIGLHSYTHPTRLAELSNESQLEEYQLNLKHLQPILGEPPVSMSHPCNSYNDDTLSILKGLGVKVGFRANMESRPNNSKLEFPRQDCANIMKEILQ